MSAICVKDLAGMSMSIAYLTLVRRSVPGERSHPCSPRPCFHVLIAISTPALNRRELSTSP
eukprot:12865480-Heterocapsa_arctica.AAC.1